uniref:Rab-GAP TBC domain-containing protein n=1 Tax=Oncorhynchus mykiss TaxID=8022 RepID=A0A8C7W3Y1_ONCMY
SQTVLRPIKARLSCGPLSLTLVSLLGSRPQTVLRIWDCLFYEGSKILFRVALTLIRNQQAEVQQAGSLPDVCDGFKHMTRGPDVEDCHTFMQKIFTEPGSLSMATITKLRETCRARIIAEES